MAVRIGMVNPISDGRVRDRSGGCTGAGHWRSSTNLSGYRSISTSGFGRQITAIEGKSPLTTMPRLNLAPWNVKHFWQVNGPPIEATIFSEGPKTLGFLARLRNRQTDRIAALPPESRELMPLMGPSERPGNSYVFSE